MYGHLKMYQAVDEGVFPPSQMCRKSDSFGKILHMRVAFQAFLNERFVKTDWCEEVLFRYFQEKRWGIVANW